MVSESFRRFGNRTARQFLSYTLIGVLVNVFGYLLYLLLTHFTCAPKLTMTVLYSLGALISFFANRHFTFRDKGRIHSAGLRYLFAQLLGYLLNLSLLLFFVDWMSFPHQIVQALAIVVVAVFLFLLSRFFVFTQRRADDGKLRS